MTNFFFREGTRDFPLFPYHEGAFFGGFKYKKRPTEEEDQEKRRKRGGAFEQHEEGRVLVILL